MPPKRKSEVAVEPTTKVAKEEEEEREDWCDKYDSNLTTIILRHVGRIRVDLDHHLLYWRTTKDMLDQKEYETLDTETRYYFSKEDAVKDTEAPGKYWVVGKLHERYITLLDLRSHSYPDMEKELGKDTDVEHQIDKMVPSVQFLAEQMPEALKDINGALRSEHGRAYINLFYDSSTFDFLHVHRRDQPKLEIPEGSSRPTHSNYVPYRTLYHGDDASSSNED